MQYEFLKQFPRRMKNVGLYSVLMQNSIQKTTWSKYGFIKADEQINLLFAVLLYIMEQSLREEHCTMDDIGAFIDNINMQYFKKDMTYEMCKAIGDFIINVVLCNEGKSMYFDGYEFEQRAYKIMNISYVANRVVYADYEVKRTSYYLTDDGYNLLLGTLEIENNMKLTIHEMIFKMHLEKQSYDKAVDEIKNVFNLLHIQLQKIQEAMGKIRRNALNYSVRDYEDILEENLETIGETKQKFIDYRKLVSTRAKELEEENINVRRLDEKEEEKLNNLKIIESYLTRAIDEHQKILNSHFDLKALYSQELEQLSQMSLIKRFPFRMEFYDKVLENAESLNRLDLFFRPLFYREPEKVYNLNKALEIQRPVLKRQEDMDTEILEFDEEAWQKEQEQRLREKRKKYERSLSCLLEAAAERGEISLAELGGRVEEGQSICDSLIPNAEIFKEIMVELIKNKEIDIADLKRERSDFLSGQSGGFQLNAMLLDIIEAEEKWQDISRIEVYRMEEKQAVVFAHVKNEYGQEKTIRCSNVLIRIVREEENKSGI